MTTFEYDPNKSNTNRDKHGIDFHEACALWNDPGMIEVPVATLDEPRFLTIGKIEGKFWTAVATFREGRIRIISVRRSRKNEEMLYEDHNSKGV
ncbi:MAG: BrnT family toxin [Syntrophales bacterium]